MRGVIKSVVEKYSDQAHFIYELLQNADDANATFAHFYLHENELVFSHNGTRHFSVSNPANEEEDSQNGKLGDVNAITSIGNSNKTGSSIGKFGAGFKAVFQYTQTPEIYDPRIHFKIERSFVPIQIEKDFPGRKINETVFVFPFDHPERSADEAYADISEKLCSLVYPTLFLANLEEVSFESKERFCTYTKSIKEEKIIGDTFAQLIILHKKAEQNEQDRLWLFSRETDDGLSYSVGFFNDGKELVPKQNFAAFCFFPTKEITGLAFIVHAPFLLTDSREGIKAGEEHNRKMIRLLANLAADSFVFLRDFGEEANKKFITDDIVNIIPYEEDNFSSLEDKSKISFKPFFTAIKEKFATERLLPTSDGKCALAQNAYWAFVPPIAELFSDVQLAALTRNEDAKWVFASFGNQNTAREKSTLADYIESMVRVIDETDILKNAIDSEFIEAQKLDWLHKFYKWIAETEKRKELAKTKPIFLDTNGNAVAAFDKNKQSILFISDEEISGCKRLNPELLKNEDTRNFIESLGIKEPSLRDEIYNVILPQYPQYKTMNGETGARKLNSPEKIDEHFWKLFRYYMDCPRSETDEYIGLIRDCPIVSYVSAKSEVVHFYSEATRLYYPSEDLKVYFAGNNSIRFLDLKRYIKDKTENEIRVIENFLTALGVKKEPRIFERELKTREALEIKEKWPPSSTTREWREKYIEGCAEILEDITAEKSIVLWKCLLAIIREAEINEFEDLLYGICEYFYYSARSERFEASNAKSLREERWLLNTSGEFVASKDISLAQLSPQYDTSSAEAKILLAFLHIVENEHLSDEERQKIEFANRFGDVPLDVLEKAAADWKRKQNGGEITIENPQKDDKFAQMVEKIKTAPSVSLNKQLKKSSIEESDEDDYTKPSVDISKKIEQKEQELKGEIERLAELDELRQKATDAKKYSYAWFSALLKIEAVINGETNNDRQEISIAFQKVEREENTERTLLLSHPNRAIPQAMEDLANIPLQLHFSGEKTLRVEIEVANVKTYTLSAKLKTNSQIEDVDLSQVIEAKIEARNAAFLWEELRKSFAQLEFADEFDMQQNLCENIEFVFGPPGTGKTTYLADEVLLPLMKEIEDLKILVLTPTNKAADVLTRKIMELMDEDLSYEDWLARFGLTNDEGIEESEVFHEKDFKFFNACSRNVTITTIARFAYDFFVSDGIEAAHLNEINWDYIVFDEASMIPLANIVYPLYKQNPKKFIVAGDPLQIEPIVSESLWKNENIYTMVGLNSFEKPTTIPHDYHIEFLTTQYRSVPEIGDVFSKFAYGGTLSHNRTSESKRKLPKAAFKIEALNLIKFPVYSHEGIYRAKRLQKSPYHMYSAFFAFELLKYLAELMSGEEIFRIGLISPYRAQADLIDRLLTSARLPENVRVQAGTMHGFQGDECDAIIALFNPPPSLSSHQEMFLNKLNIVNVSISRARDFLFVMLPDDDTRNIANLKLVKQVEKLCKASKNCTEYRSNDLEKLLFGSASYIDDNTFSTGHQDVNIYGKPEKKYEIRSADIALDVQLNEEDVKRMQILSDS